MPDDDIEALVCKKCGPLCGTTNEFVLGAVAARHTLRRMHTHKLEIKKVPKDAEIVDAMSVLYAQVLWKELFGE